jgi:release factor glutamine methyltransferase
MLPDRFAEHTERPASLVKTPGNPKGAEETQGKILSEAIKELSVLGPNEAQASAERLLEDVLGCTRTDLILNLNRCLDNRAAEEYRRRILLRKERVPVAYISGKAFFRDEELEVNQHCLIPRPETEWLVEKFIEHSGYKRSDLFTFLDVGTGSGAIGIALLRNYPQAKGTFLDISSEALNVAQRNLENSGFAQRANIVHSDLWEVFRVSGPGKKWDAIISNPPYLSQQDLEHLQPEVRFEPRAALDGGKDGYDFYRRMIPEAKNYLIFGGWIVLEVGMGQAAKVAGLLSENQYLKVQIYRDHSEINRIVMARNKTE